MRAILDSHTLIWAADDPSQLSATALAVIQEPANDRLMSAATMWEIGIKVGKGRLTLSLPYRQWMDQVIADLCLTLLPITLDHTDRQSQLPPHHGDPFDRLMLSQALVEAIPIVSADVAFDPYGVTRLW